MVNKNIKLPFPGETLLELMQNSKISESELAKRTNFDANYIHEVCKGRQPISLDFAKSLSSIFNLSTDFWMNLQTNYDSEIKNLS